MASPSEPGSPRSAQEGGKLQVKIPVVPGLVSYELELRPDSFLAKLWRRSSFLARLALLVGLVLVVALVGLGGWRLLHESTPAAPPPPARPPEPALYAVRVVVLGPDGRPIERSDIRASAGNEPQRVAGGWEVEIPRAKVPEDGQVTLWAEHPPSSAHGSEELVLGDDPTPAVEIRLRVPETAVRGSVLGPDGRALADAVVSVSGRGDEAVVTGPAGAFELPAHRPPGQQVRLHVEHPDHPPKDQYCWAGGTECEIRLRSP